MAGKKKEQRRQRKAAAKAQSSSSSSSASQGPSMAANNQQEEKEEEEEVWYTVEGAGPAPPGSVVLPADEWFRAYKESVLNVPLVGTATDGLFRNMIRFTVQAWTRDFGTVPVLIGKNWLWVQLLLIDENRVIQGKFHGLGGKVAFAKDHTNIAERSRNLFKEAVPFLLQGGGVDHWGFSRSKLVSGYNCLVDDASDFPEYDPLHSVRQLPVDIPSGVRCTEAFLILAGDFEDRDGGFSTRGAVIDLLHELSSTQGHNKLLGFAVCCSSVQVSREKLRELKDVHMTA